MKPRRMAIGAALCFGAGALLASRGARDPLRNTLQTQAPIPRPSNPIEPGLAGVDHSAGDERFTHVLSALQERSKLKRDHDLYKAVGDLSGPDVAAMIERAARLPSAARQQVTSALMERWFELDVSSAAAWVREHPSELRYWAIWAIKAPESMIAEALSQRVVPYREPTLDMAVAAIVGKDQKKQAAYLAAMPAAPARDENLGSAILTWSTTDPAAAFEFARNLPAGSLRQSSVEGTLRVWAELDPQRAAREVDALVPQLVVGLEGNPTVATVARELSKHDPEAALAWLNQLPDEHCGTEPYITAASVWADREPIAALTWCRENGLDASGMGAAVIDAAMSTEPIATLEWIQAIPEVDMRNRWLEAALRTKSELNRASANDAAAKTFLDFLQQLPFESQERIAYQLGSQGGYNTDLKGVLRWTERLSNEGLRAAAVEAAVISAANRDLMIRDELLAEFPTGPERDGALAGVAAFESKKTPTLAALTAKEITDPTARFRSLDRIVSDWAERNPAEARAWLLQDRALPSDWKQEWLTDSMLQP